MYLNKIITIYPYYKYKYIIIIVSRHLKEYMKINYNGIYLHSKPLLPGTFQSLSRRENCQETALSVRNSQLKFILNICIKMFMFWFSLNKYLTY